MAKNSFDFEAHLSRHSHNISAGFTSSLVTGPIVPQYFDILGPGDSLYFTPKCFARLQDIVAPFFGEIDVHFDAFFVPLQMIYTAYGSVFAQTNDILSSLYAKDNNSVPNKFPLLLTDWNNGHDLSGFYYGHTECFGKETMRLLDALDCNAMSVLTPGNGADTPDSPPSSDGYLYEVTNSPKVISPWFFAAYQAIYQKFFRNDDYERFDIQSYNIDQYYNVDPSDGFSNPELYKLRYCQRPNDYFTSLKVSPISSAVNSNSYFPDSDNPSSPGSRFPANGGSLLQRLSKVNDYLGFETSHYLYGHKSSENDNIYPNDVTFLVDSISSSVSSFSGSTIAQNTDFYPTAANIRALFAVDKFARIYGRAGKTYDEQIQAHFGIDIPHDVKHDLTHINHWRMSLVAEPVYSTADTGEGGSSIGQVGGQSSNSLQAKQEKFTAPVHGVFMIVCYANTKPRYFGTFNKLHFLKDRLDFPIPEFDKLGMQPLYAFEVLPPYLSTTEGLYGLNTRIGWQRRYAQFKQKYNRVSLLYMNTNLVREITTSPNAFSPYVLSRSVFDSDIFYTSGSGTAVNYDSFLVPASQMFETCNALNGVMAVDYTGSWSVDYWKSPQSVFDTDPIIMDFYCDAKKVSWMSETGEPDL